MPAATIQAVIVNHNTSVFTELALRSLLARHPALPAMSITIVDNGSTDDMTALRAFAAGRGIPIVASEYGPGTTVNSHGEVLAGFVLSHPAASHYLLLDADICFLEEGTLSTMLDELEADERAFAIQPRVTWDGVNDHTECQGGFWTEVREFRLGITWSLHAPGADAEALPPASFRTVDAPLRPRLHPFCALIRNSEAFRLTVEHVGLSEAWIWENGGRHGGFYDTLGLASHVMRTHGKTWICSTARVLHFFNVSYNSEGMDGKRRRCLELLGPLRAAAATARG